MKFKTLLDPREIFSALCTGAESITFHESEDGIYHWTGFIPEVDFNSTGIANRYFSFYVFFRDNKSHDVTISEITDTELIPYIKKQLS